MGWDNEAIRMMVTTSETCRVSLDVYNIRNDVVVVVMVMVVVALDLLVVAGSNSGGGESSIGSSPTNISPPFKYSTDGRPEGLWSVPHQRGSPSLATG